MQFDVTVQRVEFREHVFRVEAEDAKAARHVAETAAQDYNFLDSPIDSAGEGVTNVVEVK